MRTKPGILRTQAFRIVLAYVLLFAFSVTALLVFTYWNTRRTLDAQTDQIIEAEITGLNEEYHHFGLPGLVETVRASAFDASDHFGWVACDNRTTRSVVKVLREDYQIPKKSIKARAYWEA